MLNIDKNQIDPKKLPKVIGKKNGLSVYEAFTKGGFSLVMTKQEILGAGPHRGFARYLAIQKHPDIVYSELSKSEDTGFNPEHYEHLTEAWNNIVDRMNAKIEL